MNLEPARELQLQPPPAPGEHTAPPGPRTPPERSAPPVPLAPPTQLASSDPADPPKLPKLLAAANVVFSALLGAFWLWIPFSVVFAGLGGFLALQAGMLLLLLWFPLQRLVNKVERIRSEAVYREGIPQPLLRPASTAGFQGFLERQWIVLSSAAFWRSTAHHVLKCLYGVVVTGLVLGTASAAGTLILAALNPAVVGYLGASAGLGSGPFPAGDVPDAVRLAAAVVGVLLLVLACIVLLFSGYVDRALDRALLPPVEVDELRREVTQLDAARAGAIDAATAERLRIERDLHDGAQPRLVALSMTLGMARAKIDSDPEAAKELLTEAHTEAKAVIGELRQLARGIHPAVLTDRGLDAAVSALAARSATPVDVQVDVPVRPGKEAESVAYFVVAESLTNINKHAQAQHAAVRITRHGDRLQVVVTDNGRGGAQIKRDGTGTGLAGLVDRVAAARGGLTLTSPLGGPTTLVMEVPCES